MSSPALSRLLLWHSTQYRSRNGFTCLATLGTSFAAWADGGPSTKNGERQSGTRKHFIRRSRLPVEHELASRQHGPQEVFESFAPGRLLVEGRFRHEVLEALQLRRGRLARKRQREDAADRGFIADLLQQPF